MERICKYEDAINAYQKCQHIQIKLYGKMSLEVALTWKDIASIYLKLNNHDEAISYCEKSKEILNDVLGENNLPVISVYIILASIYAQQGKLKKSLNIFHRTLDILLTIQKNKKDKTDQLKLNNSVSKLFKAVDIQEQILMNYTSLFGELYNNIENIGVSQSRLDEANEICCKWRQIQQQILDENHPDLAVTNCHLGTILAKQGKYKDALEMFQQSIDIQNKCACKNNILLANTYRNIATIYKLNGNNNSAVIMYQNFLNVQKALLGSDHPKFIEIYQEVSKICSKELRKLTYFLKFVI